MRVAQAPLRGPRIAHHAFSYPWCHQIRTPVMIRHASPPTNSSEPAGMSELVLLLPGSAKDAPMQRSNRPIAILNKPSNCWALSDFLVFSIVTWPVTGIGAARGAGETATVIAGEEGAGGGAGATGVNCNPLTFDTGSHSPIPSRHTTMSPVMRPSLPNSDSCCDVYGPNFSPSLARCQSFFPSVDIDNAPLLLAGLHLSRDTIPAIRNPCRRGVKAATNPRTLTPRQPPSPTQGYLLAPDWL